MQTILNDIAGRVREAIRGAYPEIPGISEVDPAVRRVQDERFGDYQSNCAMGLAKQVGQPPRAVAETLVKALRVDDLCEQPEIAGPGFINFRVLPSALSDRLNSIPSPSIGGADRLGIAAIEKPLVHVVDFSSPNLAKEMHVGHLRSTVIGESIARILEFQGHGVRRVNHVGDWGTQFGMLLTHLSRTQPDLLSRPDSIEIGDLEAFYVSAKAAFDADPEFAEAARLAVVKLQGGDPTMLRIWKAFCHESLRHCHRIYDLLGVKLEDCGESFYNPMLAEVVQELTELGMTEVSEGATCVFLEGFKTRDGTPLPMIVQKTDGGYNYDTTDLAAIRYRLKTLKAKGLIYVVGAPQKLHFDQLFAAARKAGWATDEVRLDHSAFGSVLGSDGRPFKTREGGTIKLKALLDGAVERALDALLHRDKEPPDGEATEVVRPERRYDRDQMSRIAETVGLSAVKYYDLSHSLSSDYRFDLDRMCALEGNTAPYMLYAYARIRSIGRKAGIDFASLTREGIIVDHPAEIRLAKYILRFAEVYEQTTRELKPNLLTDYLFELSKVFSQFYDRAQGVRVIDASPSSVRFSRLRLCDLTARTLKLGLWMLGIPVLEEM